MVSDDAFPMFVGDDRIIVKIIMDIFDSGKDTVTCLDVSRKCGLSINLVDVKMKTLEHRRIITSTNHYDEYGHEIYVENRACTVFNRRMISDI